MNNISYRSVVKYFAIFLMSAMVFTVFSQKAHAEVTLSPDPGDIPEYIRNEMVNSDAQTYSPGFLYWISSGDNAGITNITVPFGTTSVYLSFNSIGTVGWSPSSTTRTGINVDHADDGGSGSFSGIDGAFDTINFGSGSNTPGTTDITYMQFNYSPAGGFTTTGDYYISVFTYVINEFNNGDYFRCVANGAAASSLSDETSCPLVEIGGMIHVTVEPLDVCPNIGGAQDSVPPGHFINGAGNCVPDVCPNIAGGQETIPPGYFLDGAGNCIIDQCPNIPGGQATVPPGYYKNGAGNCIPVPSIGCSISGVETLVMGAATFTPQVSVWHTGASGSPDVSVAVSYDVNTSPSYSQTSPLVTVLQSNRSGNPVVVDLSSHTINSPGPYTATASVSGSGDGQSVSATCNPITIRAVYLPYFKVYNGDVRVGGGFNSGETQCTTPSGVGRVAAWSTGTSPNYRGASSEFALMALGAVSGGGFGGFYSAQTNLAATPQYKPLTFGNDAATGTYGGNLGGQHCIRDYFTTTQQGTVPQISGGTMSWSSIYAQRNPTTNQIQINGNVTITGPPLTIGVGQKLTVYVNNGNIFIDGSGAVAADVMLATNTYTSQAQIPFFSLVVRGGNIMIGPNVTQLDGIYVAQPTGINTGGVYTCATGLTAVCPANTLYTQGSKKLHFFGSVVAKTIKLLRTSGHILAPAATAGEAQSSANIAEVFIGMPELYIANPAFAPDVSETRLYDSATSLPPLL